MFVTGFDVGSRFHERRDDRRGFVVVQGRPTVVVARFELGACIEKRRDDSAWLVLSRYQVQGGLPAFVPCPDVRAGIEQCGDVLGSTLIRRTVQRRPAVLVPRLRIGAGIQQHRDRRRGGALHREMQGRPGRSNTDSSTGFRAGIGSRWFRSTRGAFARGRSMSTRSPDACCNLWLMVCAIWRGTRLRAWTRRC